MFFFRLQLWNVTLKQLAQTEKYVYDYILGNRFCYIRDKSVKELGVFHSPIAL